MKILFENQSYIEVAKSHTPGKIIITIAAKNNEKPLETIANSVELSEEQFNNLVKI